jgi:hypothetical protein
MTSQFRDHPITSAQDHLYSIPLSIPKVTFQSRWRVNLLVLLLYLIVNFVYTGLIFGDRGLSSGDDWYFVTGSTLNFFPLCTGITNNVNPWRPLVGTPICIISRIFPTNIGNLYILSLIAYTVAAFAWYCLAYDLFDLPSWLSAVTGLIYLSYPNDAFRINLNIATVQILGSALTLCAIWLAISFWVKPFRVARLILACLLAIISWLIFEAFLVAWVIGLPLALLYKSHRFSSRWFRVSLTTTSIAVGYLLWRYLILPSNPVQTSVVTSYSVVFSVEHILQQVRDSYVIAFQRWIRAFDVFNYFRTFDRGTHAASIGVISIALTVAVVAITLILYRSDRDARKRVQSAVLLGAAIILIPILMAPFYVIDLNLVDDSYRAFGTPFAASLGVVGILSLLRSLPLRIVATLATGILMAGFFSVYASYTIYSFKDQQTFLCDFFLRLTDQIEQLPRNLYVVVRSPQWISPHFSDDFLLSSFLARLYYSGPYTPEGYRLGIHGYSGYLIFFDPAASLNSSTIQAQWPKDVKGFLHIQSPLPASLSTDNTILIDYVPMQHLEILSRPSGINGLFINTKGGSTASPRSLAESYCAWTVDTGRKAPALVTWDFDKPLPLAIGWGNPEVDNHGLSFQWTTSTHATIVLPIPNAEDAIIRFRVQSAIAPEIMTGLALFANDSSVDLKPTFEASGGAVYAGSILKSVLTRSPGHLTLMFQINRVARPSDLFVGSQDQRLLGIALDWLRIEPVFRIGSEAEPHMAN